MSDATILATELARAIYRLTNDLSEAEPLRTRLREAALDIAARRSREAFLSVEAMLALLRVAKAQGFAREENFALLDRAYRQLQDLERREKPTEPIPSEPLQPGDPINTEEIYRASPERSKWTSAAPMANEERKTHDVAGNAAKLQTLNTRQKKIVQHFHYRQAFQLREARSLFEGYSQKTLRNDLRNLCLKGILSREGVGTTSFYRVAVKMPN